MVCLDRLLHLIHHNNNGVQVWYGIPHPQNCTIGLPVFDCLQYANREWEGKALENWSYAVMSGRP